MRAYLNAYHVTRQYAGPEEGGTYRNHGEPLATVPLDPDMTIQFMDEMAAWIRKALASYDSKIPLSSVRSSGILDVHIEDHPAEAYPTEPYRYE